MGSPSRNVQYHPPRLSEDRLNLPQPHSPSLPTHCSGKSGMRPHLQSANEHDVQAVAQRLHAHGGARRRGSVAVQPQHVQPTGVRHRPARRGVPIPAETRTTAWRLRTAGRHGVARGHGPGARLRGGRQRPLPRPRRWDRRVAVGGQGRIAGQRFSVTCAVDGQRYVVEGTGTDANTSRWSAMLPSWWLSSGNSRFVFALQN